MVRHAGILMTAITAVLAAGCADRLVPEMHGPDGNTIEMTVSLEKEDLCGGDGTRVTLGGDGALKWEGDESVGIIFAQSSTSGKTFKKMCELKTVEGKPGIFSGTIDLGNYSANDIIGIVYPFSSRFWGKWHNTTKKKRIVIQVACEDQIQQESGVLEGDLCPLFAEVKPSDFKVNGRQYSLEGKKLQWGCSLFEFTIYGKHSKGETGERIESVELFASTTICCAGTAEWIVGSNSFMFNGNTDTPYLVTRLENPASFGRSAALGATLYSASLPRGENDKSIHFNRIFIVTDKAVYEKEVNRDLVMKAGVLHPVMIDLSTCERTSRTVSDRSGRDSLMMISYSPLRHRPVKIYYYVPSGFNAASSPLLFAMHGSGRTALSCLKVWEGTAADRNVLVMAPEFTKELYNNARYQFGGVSSSSSEYIPQPDSLWTYNIIEEAFDVFRTAKGSGMEKYDISGHSAGGQFTHRFLLNMPDARVNRAVGSNAGSYTVPDPKGISDGTATYGFPYSIKDMNVGKEQLRKFFARDFTVHLGTADLATTVEEDENLPVSAGAEAEGACRYERGHFFYDRARRVADSLGMPFNWKLVEVKGVGHSSSKMVQAAGTGAAAILYP